MSEAPLGHDVFVAAPPLLRRHALVIGVNGSPHSGLGDLTCAEHDAEQMHEVLSSPACGFSVTRLSGAQATSAEVLSAIISLICAHRDPDDFLLFYFSGHGRYVGDDVYLVTSTFNPKEAEFVRNLHVSLRLLRELLYERTQAGRVLLILDCCYSGEFAGSGPDVSLEDLLEQIRRYLTDNFAAPSKTTSAPRDAQRWTLAATLFNEQANEGAGLGSPSLLTGHILRGIRGKEETVLDDNGTVHLERLVIYLREALNGQQSPELIGASGGKNCVLACHPDKTRAALVPDMLTRIRGRQPLFAGRPETLAQNFVGRTAELQVIRDKITRHSHTGAYMTIVGPPGQGKSSVIARLLADEGPAQAVYHFIPNEPGHDPQKTLLQELIARLIVEHNLLPDLRAYVFEGKDRGDLVRDFHDLLTRLGTKGIQETIYIDGLDQLPIEPLLGRRDLAFLPEQVPPGIVFVLGTRPDDTLEPFQSREPVVRHELTAFSLEDFRLLLKQRQVLAQVEGQLDAFHSALQGNALYLDHLAEELQRNPQWLAEEVSAIIRRLKANPGNIFSLTLHRLQRSPLWASVLRPTLGLLLVTQEPLPREAIQSFVQCPDAMTCSQGLEQLGSLLVQTSEGHYALFHPKFGEYLRQRKEEAYDNHVFSYHEVLDLHRQVAAWCIRDTADLDGIWQDDTNPLQQARRVYARQYYIVHLAHGEAWETLWKTLDEGTYGRHKIRDYDPSTRAYALDLDRGRQAAGRHDVPFAKGLQLLPRLWFYSLLRGSLTSRADAYPDGYYETLVMMGRVHEAMSLAELLPDVDRKARVFRLIAMSLCSGPSPSSILLHASQLLLSAAELLRGFTDPEKVVREIAQLSMAFSQLGDQKRASDLISEAERVAARLKGMARAKALGAIAEAYARTQRLSDAERLLKQAEQVAARLKGAARADALEAVAEAYARAQRFSEAERVAARLGEDLTYTRTLVAIAQAYARAQRLSDAERVAARLGERDRAKALGAIAEAYAQAQRFSEAERVAARLEGESRATALGAIAQAYARAQRLSDAERLLKQAERVAAQLLWGSRAAALDAIAQAYARAQRFSDAERLLKEAGRVAVGHNGEWTRAVAVGAIAEAYARAQRFSEAERVAARLGEDLTYTRTLVAIAQAYAQAQRLSDAERLLKQAERVAAPLKEEWALSTALEAIAEAYAQVQRFSDAERVAARLGEDLTYTRTLVAIAQAYAQAQRLSDAERLLKQAEWVAARLGERDRAKALGAIAEAYAQAQRLSDAERLLKQAEWVAAQIGEEWIRAEALEAVAEAYAQTQRLSDAKRVTARLKWDFRATALEAIAEAYARAQRFSEAERVAARLKGLRRAEALGAIAQAYARAQRFSDAERLLKDAERVAAQIEDWMSCPWALETIAQAYAHITALANGDQRTILQRALLHFVQRQWLQATTHGDLTRLLNLACPLLRYDSTNEVGFDLINALDRIEHFW